MRQNANNVSQFSSKARNTYVIEHITDALIKLLKEKSIDEISISELCSLAGIGRASFYRNFASKEDILSAYINKIFKEGMLDLNQKENKSLNESLGILFSHFEKYRDFYSLINDKKLLYLLKDVIIGIYGPKKDNSKLEAYSRAYIAYVLYGWVEVWFQRGMKESAEEIAELFKSQGL